jgi:hypothetical protein
MRKKTIKIEVTVEIEFLDEPDYKEAVAIAKRDVIALKTGGSYWKNTPKKAKLIKDPRRLK